MRYTPTAVKWLAVFVIAALLLAGCGDSKSNSNSNSNGTQAADNTSSAASSSNDPSKSTETKVDEPKETVTVDFWHAYGEGEEKVLKEKVIPLFEQQYPSIKIKATRMPTENLEQQVLTSVAGGAAPDVMRMDLTWVPNMAMQGALQPVSQMPGFEEIKNASYAGPMDSNRYNGDYYGVPLDTNTRVAIYNKDLLELAGAAEAPKTIDELVNLARTLKSKGKYTGITIGGPDVWNFSSWFWTLGGTYTDPTFTKASGYINSDASIKALETIAGWKEEGLLSPPIIGGQPGTWEGLRGDDKGSKPQYMMIDDGPWFFSLLGDDSTKGKMIPALIPAGPDGKSHSVVGGENMVIFNGAKHPEEAWEFVKFMDSKDIQVLLAKETGQIPVIKEAAADPALKDVWYLQTYVDQLEDAYTRTPSPNANKINDALQAAFESVLRNKTDAKSALDKVAPQIDDLLSQ